MPQNTAVGKTRQVSFLDRADELPDWSVFQAERGADPHCQSCGLPAWAVGRWYRIPDLPGCYCSIRCAECFLCGYGRCRWCAKRLDGKADRRFCGESCSRASRSVRFGDGTRLWNYICRRLSHVPLPHNARSPRCRYCGTPLDRKRSDAEFCGDRCRKRADREVSRSAKNPAFIADTEPKETTTCRHPIVAVDQNPLVRGSKVYRGHSGQTAIARLARPALEGNYV